MCNPFACCLPCRTGTVAPTLVSLTAAGTRGVGGIVRAATYQAGGDVIVIAQTAPNDSPAEHAQIAWTPAVGVAIDGMHPHDRRLVSRNAITAFGGPGAHVTASLGGQIRSMDIIIEPTLDQLTVANVLAAGALDAPANADEYYGVYANGGNVTIDAVTTPAGAGAAAYIVWAGAAPGTQPRSARFRQALAGMHPCHHRDDRR